MVKIIPAPSNSLKFFLSATIAYMFQNPKFIQYLGLRQRYVHTKMKQTFGQNKFIIEKNTL